MLSMTIPFVSIYFKQYFPRPILANVWNEIELLSSRKCKHIKIQSNLIWKQINKSSSNIHSFKEKKNIVGKQNRKKSSYVLVKLKIHDFHPLYSTAAEKKTEKLKTGKTKNIIFHQTFTNRMENFCFPGFEEALDWFKLYVCIS